MRQKINVSLPSWAIPQSAVEAIELPVGFLRDFNHYVNLCTDAPKSFALGTGLGILAVACGNCDLVVEGSDGLINISPIRLWQALVGNSGQRKSRVLELGIGLLQNTGQNFLLPDDASIEAWHDTVAEQNISLMYQEELSGIFDAQLRSYTIGLQSWMLKLWSGTPKDRKTKGKGSILIERPRFSILGAIPPDVFFRKTKALDWRSGFLPRFLYWGGCREEWSPHYFNSPRQETALSNYLRDVFVKSDGEVFIPVNVSNMLSEWFYAEIEMRALSMLEDTYAGLLRLQETGYVIAGLIALSRAEKIVCRGAGKRHVVCHEDMKAAIKILKLCKLTIESISSRANQSAISVSEDLIYQHLSRQSEGVTIKELANSLRLSYRECRQHLMDLIASQIVTSQIQKSGTRGRPATIYKVAE